MSKNRTKPQPISGFPEWLPGHKAAEQAWIDTIRHVFESYGFGPIETPSIEALDTLLAKGETDKEIYVLKRLQEDDANNSDARLGLHYDLTVPFARYAAQHFNDLSFPFKRYQIQRAWRGERPQEGRFREFYQCDIDVINVDSLPLHFDAEMPLIIGEVLERLRVPNARLHISNRKILAGYVMALGIEDIVGVIRILDKLDKLGRDGVHAALLREVGLDTVVADRLLALGEIRSGDESFAERVQALGVGHPVLEEGIEELRFVMRALAPLPDGMAVADLSIARGFDYYTGTVYEGRLTDYPGFGSVVSGGRYDDLAGSFINRKLPGVGISLGLSRLFSKMVDEGLIEAGRPVPTDILVILPSEETRTLANQTGATLRRRGFNVEVFHNASKLKRQLAYAEKKQIPFVWFPPFEAGQDHEVKDMTRGTQSVADPKEWQREISTTRG